MIWNGFLMGIGILLFFVVFDLIGSLIATIAKDYLEKYEEKEWYKELNKYNWKNRRKKNV